jgi:hypothetical protein
MGAFFKLLGMLHIYYFRALPELKILSTAQESLLCGF